MSKIISIKCILKNGAAEWEELEEITIDDLIKERDHYRGLVQFIAHDYLELSYDKVEWQRNDWYKRARKCISDLYTANKQDMNHE